MYKRGHVRNPNAQKPHTAKSAATTDALGAAVWAKINAERPQDTETSDQRIDRHIANWHLNQTKVTRDMAITDDVTSTCTEGYKFMHDQVRKGAWPLAHQVIGTDAYTQHLMTIERLRRTAITTDDCEDLRDAFRSLWALCRQGDSHAKTTP